MPTELAKSLDSTAPVSGEGGALVAAPVKRRGRFQFSLGTLVLVFILIAACMGLVLTQRDLNQVRSENKKYRDELGILVIDDPTKPQAQPATVFNETRDTWAWHVYIPPSGKYHLRCAIYDELNRQNFLTRFDPQLEDGQCRMTISLRNDRLGKPQFYLGAGAKISASASMPEKLPERLGSATRLSWGYDLVLPKKVWEEEERKGLKLLCGEWLQSGTSIGTFEFWIEEMSGEKIDREPTDAH